MQRPDAMVTAGHSLMPINGKIEISRCGLGISLLQELVSALLPSRAAPSIMANSIYAAVKVKTGDIIHLDATSAMRKPATIAATHIRLLSKSSFRPEADAWRRQNLQVQLERIQS